MRVLLTSVPGIGHLHPMLPLAEALIAQDEEVLYEHLYLDIYPPSLLGSGSEHGDRVHG